MPEIKIFSFGNAVLPHKNIQEEVETLKVDRTYISYSWYNDFNGKL